MYELIAVFASGTFFGAAIYISIAQHPASLDAGGAFPGTFFPFMYRRAAPMQILLALAGSIAGFIQWYLTSALVWLLGSLALISVIPITLIIIKPVNDVLLDKQTDPTALETLELLKTWGHQHWIRSIVSGVAFLIFLAGVAADLSASG